MAKWTHTDSFAHFGTTPRNVQWSWSARNEEKKVVVVTLWQDRFRKDQGELVYERPPEEEGVRRRPGFSEMMDNLRWAVDNCDGMVRVIVAKARDVTADPRSIEECFPSKMVMKLTNFDPETGEFRAKVVGH